MEKMRELVQRSSSGSTELAASAEQMSKMSRMMLETMDRFILEAAVNGNARNGASQGHEQKRTHMHEPEFAVAGEYN
jgi:hypothetical protein